MSLFPDRLETERLELEALTTERLDPMTLYEYCGSHVEGIEDVTRYLTWEPHDSPKVSRDFIELTTEDREAGERSAYVVRPKQGEDRAGEFAGLAGIGVDWERRMGTLGMWLRKPFWGRGYSGERASAFMQVAFERLDLDVVAVECDADNEKSRRAIEKYVEVHGGQQEGTLRNWTDHGDGPATTHRYSVTREEYRRATGE